MIKHYVATKNKNQFSENTRVFQFFRRNLSKIREKRRKTKIERSEDKFKRDNIIAHIRRERFQKIRLIRDNTVFQRQPEREKLNPDRQRKIALARARCRRGRDDKK